MTAPGYTWKSLSLPSLWIIYPFPRSLEALATRDVVLSAMWWVSGAFLLLCHPCEIALAAVSPGVGVLAGWLPLSVLHLRRQDRELIRTAS